MVDKQITNKITLKIPVKKHRINHPAIQINIPPCQLQPTISLLIPTCPTPEMQTDNIMVYFFPVRHLITYFRQHPLKTGISGGCAINRKFIDHNPVHSFSRLMIFVFRSSSSPSVISPIFLLPSKVLYQPQRILETLHSLLILFSPLHFSSLIFLHLYPLLVYQLALAYPQNVKKQNHNQIPC